MDTTQEPMAEELLETPTTTALHFSFAKYGRVGKSTWLKLLIEYMLVQGRQHIIVDTDKETPNVAKAYTPERLDRWLKMELGNDMLFSDAAKNNAPTEPEDKINSLLAEQVVFSDDNRTEYLTRNLLSLSQFGKDILVNLPANVYNPVCDFITNNNLHRSPKVKLFNWWVSNGSEESLELFDKTQAKFPEANHILVLNTGNFQYIYDWKRFRLPEKVSKLYKSGKIKVIQMPFLSVEPTFWQSQDGTPYHRIIKDNTIDEFVRAAIETWMLKAFTSIEETKCI
jgi:hypothetical protein